MNSNSNKNVDSNEFNDVYKEIVSSLYEELPQELLVVSSYFKSMTDYTVPHGKQNRGLMVKAAYTCLAKSGDSTHENLKLADVAGWCIEWMQASFLVHDDIMDQSKTRRNMPCWYIEAQKRGFGLISINDGIHLNAVLYIILDKYFKDKPYYTSLVRLYQDTIHKTCIGQCLDMMTSPEKIDLAQYTVERYRAIVKWKTAFYSFYLPIAAAMLMAGITDEKYFKCAEKILLIMGEYFQIQDDYLDCYGDPAVTGKIGTDIEEGKCSWLVVQALDRVNKEQQKIIEENYGRREDECANRIKNLYSVLKMKDIYADYESKSYAEVTQLINAIDIDLSKDMFHQFVQRIYKRKK